MVPFFWGIMNLCKAHVEGTIFSAYSNLVQPVQFPYQSVDPCTVLLLCPRIVCSISYFNLQSRQYNDPQNGLHIKNIYAL